MLQQCISKRPYQGFFYTLCTLLFTCYPRQLQGSYRDLDEEWSSALSKEFAPTVFHLFQLNFVYTPYTLISIFTSSHSPHLAANGRRQEFIAILVRSEAGQVLRRSSNACCNGGRVSQERSSRTGSQCRH